MQIKYKDILDINNKDKSNFQPFFELMMHNRCALLEIETKLKVLDEEFNVINDRNPIQSITSRIKKPVSILNKLDKKGIDPTIENMSEYIHDIAGIRVVCSFTEDIYVLVNMLLAQDDIKLVKMKDYIKNPKENGYRSLHLIVEVPIFLSDEKKKIKIEVQFRTIAMDFWASIEHQLKYKKNIKNEDLIVEQLKECADIVSTMDAKMLDIRYMIDNN